MKNVGHRHIDFTPTGLVPVDLGRVDMGVAYSQGLSYPFLALFASGLIDSISELRDLSPGPKLYRALYRDRHSGVQSDDAQVGASGREWRWRLAPPLWTSVCLGTVMQEVYKFQTTT